MAKCQKCGNIIDEFLGGVCELCELEVLRSKKKTVPVIIDNHTFGVEYEKLDNYAYMLRYGDILGFYRVFFEGDMKYINKMIDQEIWNIEEIEKAILTAHVNVCLEDDTND